ncbi:SRPBCC family protein [Roseospira visakhapatnamensis]|uniref:Carbon monoxide dehydrogenase subunit G n=1 Tax=Roseospira visakhapatnamensis TaxID=390880 RepID=A0A7W6RGA7_9PROT|nr:carbon monoxide dehydrogenase subunit G [Roseospira visakhapatnamensis]MBB4267436.1 hypothetical protein [Roseospira visakhapatnamensis]
MDFSGNYRVPAPRETVWDALNDPGILKDCIDGCESFEKVSDTEFQARVKAKVGPVSARFSTTVTLSEMDPPNSYLITGQGQGGAAGFVKGGARVTLAEDGADTTLLTYESQATVGGKLASVGGRLIKGVAEKTADDFFRRFTERVTGADQPEDEDVDEDVDIAVPDGDPREDPDDEDDGPGVFEKLATIDLSVKDKLVLAGLALLTAAMVAGMAVAIMQ